MASKSAVPSFLKTRPTYFALNYSYNYQTFLRYGILDNVFHPLYPLRKRIEDARPRKGLWWHATAGPATSSTRIVRNWAMRRLRLAFLETLRERGVDEDGKINPRLHKHVDESIRASHKKGIREALARGEEVEITGSLKLHAMPAIVTAKFVDVKRETGVLVDGLLNHLANSLRTRHTQGISKEIYPPTKHFSRDTAEQPWKGKAPRAAGLAAEDSGSPRLASRTGGTSSASGKVKAAVKSPLKVTFRGPAKAAASPVKKTAVKAPAKGQTRTTNSRPSFLKIRPG